MHSAQGSPVRPWPTVAALIHGFPLGDLEVSECLRLAESPGLSASTLLVVALLQCRCVLSEHAPADRPEQICRKEIVSTGNVIVADLDIVLRLLDSRFAAQPFQ